MGQAIASTNWKLVSQYDNAGIRLAITDIDAIKAKTAGIMDKARNLTPELLFKAERQNYERRIQDEKTLTAVMRTRHEQAMQFIFQEGEAAEGRFMVRGGAGKGGMFSRGAAQNLQQLGFMTQDFASQFQNAKDPVEGFSRGIAAISNNIQVMGASLGPQAQAMFAIGGAATGIIVPAIARWLADTTAIEEKAKAIKSAYESIGPTVKGIEQGALFSTNGKTGAEKARDAIDQLTNKITAASNTSSALKRMIEEEQQGGDANRVAAMQKHQLELTEEIRKAEAERAGIQMQWSAVRLRDGLAAAEKEKKDKKDLAQYEKEQEQQRQANLQALNAREQAEKDRANAEMEKKEYDLRTRIDELRDKGITANGSSAAGIRGTSAAASAINRAVAGTRSEETDRKQQIKVAEDSLKELRDIKQKLAFKKAGLGA